MPVHLHQDTRTLCCYLQGVALTENQGKSWGGLVTAIILTFSDFPTSRDMGYTQALERVHPKPQALPAPQGAKSDA